jgi:hypothetical protein
VPSSHLPSSLPTLTQARKAAPSPTPGLRNKQTSTPQYSLDCVPYAQHMYREGSHVVRGDPSLYEFDKRFTNCFQFRTAEASGERTRTIAYKSKKQGNPNIIVARTGPLHIVFCTHPWWWSDCSPSPCQ